MLAEVLIYLDSNRDKLGLPIGYNTYTALNVRQESQQALGSDQAKSLKQWKNTEEKREYLGLIRCF